MAVMAIVAMTASAQIEKGLRFGITVSGSMSKYSEINGAKNTFGCGGGLTVEYSFNPNVYIGTGLQFGLRGTKVDALEVSGQTISVDGINKSMKYVYYVKDYSNEGSSDSSEMSKSDATVKVYSGDKLLYTFTVPYDVVGTYWKVFEYDPSTDTLTPSTTVDNNGMYLDFDF